MTTDAKKILQMSSLAVFFLLIIVYAFWGSHNLIFGVKIKNVNINNSPMRTETKVARSVVSVSGNAQNAINLTLNGREISIDEKGNFNETIALLSGYNIMSITAKDKFGYIDEKNFRLIGGFAEEAKL